MDKDTQSSHAIHVMVALVTLIVVGGGLHFWLPNKVERKAHVSTDFDGKGNVTALQEQVPQGLLDYIKENRPFANSLTDHLNEEELIDTYEELQQDFTGQAQEILAQRFQIPGLEEDILSEEGGFVVPESIKDIVTFWIHVFGLYGKEHVVFYNTERTGIVYSVLDFSELEGIDEKGAEEVKAEMIAFEKDRLKKMLKNVLARLKVHKGTEAPSSQGLTAEEARILNILFAQRDVIDVSEKGLRSNFAYRYGFAHRIREAIVTSGLYMEEMRRIFRERGLPEKLTVIPFVESAFNLKAYSRSGAAGVWQFIESTGRRYLRIDEFVDERYDPILSAYAAATHLRHEYNLLKSWPLTINAYNTGPGRMLQAMRELKTTDIGAIVQKFKGGGYGFDSRNYYPEFLAALAVVENQEYYFGEVRTLPAQIFEYVALPSAMNIPELSRVALVPIDVLAELNHTLKDAVLWGENDLPAGYLLKIEPSQKDDILLAMQELYSDVRYATHHKVDEGDNLKKIAHKYDVPLKDLAEVNNLLPHEKLKLGSLVKLPGRGDTELSVLNDDTEGRVVPDSVTSLPLE